MSDADVPDSDAGDSAIDATAITLGSKPLPAPRKRRLKTIAALGLILVGIVALVGWSSRCALLEWGLEAELPPRIAAALNVHCTLGSATVTELVEPTGQLKLQFDSLAITEASWGSVRSEQIKLHYSSWRALYDAPQKPLSVSIGPTVVELSGSDAAPAPQSLGELLELIQQNISTEGLRSWAIPSPLLAIPTRFELLDVRVQHASQRSIDISGAIDANGGELRASNLRSPHRAAERVGDQAHLTFTLADGALPQLHLDVTSTSVTEIDPAANTPAADSTAKVLSLDGSLQPHEAGWQLHGKFTTWLGRVTGRVDTTNGTDTPLQGQVTLTLPKLVDGVVSGEASLALSAPIPLQPLLKAAALSQELCDRAPPLATTELALSCLDNTLKAELTCATSQGTLTLEGTANAERIDAVLSSVAWSLPELAQGTAGTLHGVVAGRVELAGVLPKRTEPNAAPTSLWKNFTWQTELGVNEGSWQETSTLFPGAPVTDGAVVTTQGASWPFKKLRLRAQGDLLGHVQLQQVTLEALGGTLSVTGTLPLPADVPWEIDVSTRNLPLEPLSRWLPIARQLSGIADIEGKLRGPRNAPQWRASGSLRDGNVAIPGWERLRDLRGSFVLTPQALQLNEFFIRVGGGTATANGTVCLEELGLFAETSAASPLDDATAIALDGDQLALKLEFERVRLLRSSDLRARGSGHIDLNGTWQRPLLTGNVSIDRGIYDRNFHPRLNPSGGSLPFDLFNIDDGFGSRLHFDVALRMSGGMLIRNNRIRVAPVGELRLGGTGQQPILTGAVTATEGTLTLPHLRLAISQAEVRFPQADPFRPRIEFQGSGKSAGYEIQASASGDLHAPEVSFVSTPFLDREDLLLLVATGQTRAAFQDANLQLQAALELARLYGPAMWERVFGRSRGPSLLDRVEITTETATTSDESDRLTVELRLYDWLSVATERDHRGDVNLDLILQHWFP